ncbi:MAG: glycosyltransferase family 4 protein [Bryobacterales bacterium]|nr:glycosyltransferase family 4 protein [Bryobacterales bacterium]
MRIGVNALYLIPGGVGGTEIYLRALLAALAEVDTANEYFVFTNRETGPDLVPAAPNFHYSPQPVNALNRPARLLYEQFRLPRQARVDVLFNPGFTAPIVPGRPQVTVFHDLQHKRHPEHFRWFDLPAWNFFLWAAVKRSTRLISVSEATRSDLLRYYNAGSTVIHHGVDQRFFDISSARAGATPDPILLCVSTLHPHKNHERLLNVFARIRGNFPNVTLVLTGVSGFRAQAVSARIEALHLGGSVCVTGWVPREELYHLFQRARAFVYPSTFEGFGMPVVEALAAGVPTACSNIEPLKTLAGDAAWLFPPDNESLMAEAITKLLRGEFPPEAGPTRASRFSWTAAARATLAVLEAAANAA